MLENIYSFLNVKNLKEYFIGKNEIIYSNGSVKSLKIKRGKIIPQEDIYLFKEEYLPN